MTYFVEIYTHENTGHTPQHIYSSNEHILKQKSSVITCISITFVFRQLNIDVSLITGTRSATRGSSRLSCILHIAAQPHIPWGYPSSRCPPGTICASLLQNIQSNNIQLHTIPGSVKEIIFIYFVANIIRYCCPFVLQVIMSLSTKKSIKCVRHVTRYKNCQKIQEYPSDCIIIKSIQKFYKTFI